MLTAVRNIHLKLKSNGLYTRVIPNRPYGPHDSSRGSDDEATGLNLKEYEGWCI
jgi:hypothetical protein